MSARPPKVRTHDFVTPIHSTIKDEVLICAFVPATRIGCIMTIRRSRLSATALADIVTETKITLAPAPVSDWQIKVVAPEAARTTVSTLLQTYPWTVQNTAWQAESETEFVYYPDSGRLRLRKHLGQTTAPTERGPIATPASAKKIKVLIVDDSPTIHKLLNSILDIDHGFEIVANVENPMLAESQIIACRPDVITLDIHMPEMNGVDLLKRLYPKYRIPAVMITSVSREEGPLVLEALSSGAVDYVQKPTLTELPIIADDLREKIRVAASASAPGTSHSSAQHLTRAPRVSHGTASASRRVTNVGPLRTDLVVAIGSSTGGTDALADIFTQLPKEIPPIVVVQHIPALFSQALARRLNDLCPFHVKEAAHGDELLPCQVLIAPGGRQMRIRPSTSASAPHVVEITDDAPVSRHKPSVDYLFESIVPLGSNAIGVILTGMGTDGANGLLKMRQNGARTVAQDEASSVVFGMPREAIRLGAAEEVIGLSDIPSKLTQWLRRTSK